MHKTLKTHISKLLHSNLQEKPVRDNIGKVRLIADVKTIYEKILHVELK